MIAINYIFILVVYYLFVHYDIFFSHSLHSIIYLINDNIISVHKRHNENISRKYASNDVDFQQFSY